MEILAPTSSNAVRALEENLWALWCRFGKGEGCRLHDEHDALWYETPIPTLPYNGVLRFAARDNVDAAVDRICEAYRLRHVPFIWMVHPSAAPLDLDARLAERGLEEAEVADGMWADLAQLPEPDGDPQGIEIRRMESTEELDAVLDLVKWRWDVRSEDLGTLRLIAQAFELGIAGSAVRCWIARRDGVAVAKAFLHVAAGCAGLYAVATRPEARGLGLARQLALRAFHVAHREGCRLGVLHSTAMARRLYTRLGFRSVAPFRIFAPPNSFHI